MSDSNIVKTPFGDLNRQAFESLSELSESHQFSDAFLQLYMTAEQLSKEKVGLSELTWNLSEMVRVVFQGEPVPEYEVGDSIADLADELLAGVNIAIGRLEDTAEVLERLASFGEL